MYLKLKDGKSKVVTLSYDDGVFSDVKLIEIMSKYGLKGTFNICSGRYSKEDEKSENINRVLKLSEAKALYINSGNEVAVHGYTHPWLDHMPMNMCTKDLMDDREKLESQFGTLVRGMAYPFGTYSDDVVASMRSVGIVYSRTVQSTHDFNMPADWMRLPATCHHNDPELMKLAHRFVEESSWGRPWMFYLWGHSYEFEGNNNWEVIEEFAEFMSG